MKLPSQIILIVTFLFLTVAAMGQTRTIKDFSAIHASSNVSIKLVHATSPKIEYRMIKGSDSDLITEVQGSTLRVKIRNNKGMWKSKAQAKVIVYYTDLEEISVSAGASLQTEEAVRSTKMSIDLSSGANADIEVICTDLDSEASSGANLQITGLGEKGRFDASSGATIDALDFVCDHVRADGSSGASITVHANKTIKADASSGASIKYKGSAEIKGIDRGWSGQIRKIK